MAIMGSILAVFLFGLAGALAVLAAKRKYKWMACVLLLCAGGAWFLFRPVCVPIEQRTNQGFYLKVFQNKNGQWHQCKIWVSRFFFL